MLPACEYPLPEDIVSSDEEYMLYLLRGLVVGRLRNIIPPLPNHDICAVRFFEKHVSSEFGMGLFDVFYSESSAFDDPMKVFACCELAMMSYTDSKGREIEKLFNYKFAGVQVTYFPRPCREGEPKREHFGTKGYILKFPRKGGRDGPCFVIFRGTELNSTVQLYGLKPLSALVSLQQDVQDFLADAMAVTLIPLSDEKPNIRVGAGWKLGEASVHAEIMEEIQDVTGDIIVAGHSLGASLALTFAAACDPATKSRINGVYTYGSPMGGNQDLSDELADCNVFRVYGEFDTVAHLISRLRSGRSPILKESLKEYVHQGEGENSLQLYLESKSTYFEAADVFGLLEHSPNIYLSKLWKRCGSRFKPTTKGKLQLRDDTVTDDQTYPKLNGKSLEPEPSSRDAAYY